MGVYTERYFAGSSYEAVATVRQWYVIKSVLRSKENVRSAVLGTYYGGC
jgi:hypothetical protein